MPDEAAQTNAATTNKARPLPTSKSPKGEKRDDGAVRELLGDGLRIVTRQEPQELEEFLAEVAPRIARAEEGEQLDSVIADALTRAGRLGVRLDARDDRTVTALIRLAHQRA